MGKKISIVEINGQQYDAISGKPLHGAVSTAAVEAAAAVSAPVNKPKLRSSRQPASHVKAHAPKKAQTLMRHVVKKPTTRTPTHTKAHGPAALAHRAQSKVVIKNSAHKVDHKRLIKASRAAKSELIKHFAPLGSVTYQAPTPGTVFTPLAAQAVQQSKPKSRPQTTAELLEKALQRATAHEQAAPKRKANRKKVASLAGGAALVVLLVGVVFNQNLPQLQLQAASARAGFDAQLPEYQPPGYSVGKLRYSEGAVATSFQSNSDGRNYTLTQKRTTWDSNALRDLFVVGQDSNYQVAETLGHTVYLYGNRNATWIKGDIIYQIQSDGTLSDRQLLELASSL
jgi:hypothetical protein